MSQADAIYWLANGLVAIAGLTILSIITGYIVWYGRGVWDIFRKRIERKANITGE